MVRVQQLVAGGRLDRGSPVAHQGVRLPRRHGQPRAVHQPHARRLVLLRPAARRREQGQRELEVRRRARRPSRSRSSTRSHRRRSSSTTSPLLQAPRVRHLRSSPTSRRRHPRRDSPTLVRGAPRPPPDGAARPHHPQARQREGDGAPGRAAAGGPGVAPRRSDGPGVRSARRRCPRPRRSRARPARARRRRASRGATSRVTTAPAATTASAPTVTPWRTVAPAPSHTPRSMTIGAATICRRRRSGASGWPEVSRLTRGPIMTSSPISMPPMSLRTQARSMNTLRPTRMFRP